MIFRSWKSSPRRPCNRADLEPKRSSSQGSPPPAHATGAFLQIEETRSIGLGIFPSFTFFSSFLSIGVIASVSHFANATRIRL